jgi:hypothetical protein
MSTKGLKSNGKGPAPYTVPMKKETEFGDIKNGKGPAPVQGPKDPE